MTDSARLRYGCAMPDLLEPPVKAYPFSNVEFARQAGLRSVESRRVKAEQAAKQKSELHQLVSTLAAAIPETATTGDEFAKLRLRRVREQLDKIDAMAFEENDPKRLKELADASARLSDQEFKLAGRPSPGSRRPPTDKAQRAGAWGELQPALPQVAPVSQVAQVQLPVQVQQARPMGWEYDEPKAAIPEPTPQPVGFAPVLS